MADPHDLDPLTPLGPNQSARGADKFPLGSDQSARGADKFPLGPETPETPAGGIKSPRHPGAPASHHVRCRPGSGCRRSLRNADGQRRRGPSSIHRGKFGVVRPRSVGHLRRLGSSRRVDEALDDWDLSGQRLAEAFGDSRFGGGDERAAGPSKIDDKFALYSSNAATVSIGVE